MEETAQVYALSKTHPLRIRKRMAAEFIIWSETTESDVIRVAALKRAKDLLDH